VWYESTACRQTNRLISVVRLCMPRLLVVVAMLNKWNWSLRTSTSSWYKEVKSEYGYPSATVLLDPRPDAAPMHEPGGPDTETKPLPSTPTSTPSSRIHSPPKHSLFRLCHSLALVVMHPIDFCTTGMFIIGKWPPSFACSVFASSV
jgi:hypothetical protein